MMGASKMRMAWGVAFETWRHRACMPRERQEGRGAHLAVKNDEEGVGLGAVEDGVPRVVDALLALGNLLLIVLS